MSEQTSVEQPTLTGTSSGPSRGSAVGAAPFVPASVDLDGLRAAARDCHGCELWEPATQTVFSAGPGDARLVLVGEQPGDQEDRMGAPFVGPAGRLLVEAIEAAGIDKAAVYRTNAVKHFRFRQDRPGARRIHQTPELEHIVACRPWLVAELRLIAPEVVVVLGATATKALLGPEVRVMRDRGRVIERETSLGMTRFVVTAHPSAVLRTPDEQRQAAYDALVADLRVAAGALDSPQAP